MNQIKLAPLKPYSPNTRVKLKPLSSLFDSLPSFTTNKVYTSSKSYPMKKTINKRQKRKKMIRDELKRQLSNFIVFPQSEGFPWKAIVSEKGYRQLKLKGWPEFIPISKRIDDFNPIELDKFEQSIQSGSIKIVFMDK